MTTGKTMGTLVQDHPLHKKATLDLRSPGLLVKWPIIGVIIFILGSLLFGGLFVNLRAHGPLLAEDNALAKTLPAIGLKNPALLKPIMDSGFYIGDQVVIVLGILLGLYFIFKRFWQELAMLALGLAGSTLLFLSLSRLISRVRPTTQIWIIEKIPGFPSGHAIEVVVFYGLLAYWLAPKMPSSFWKGVVVAAALLIMGFVGFTRIFTGGHYLTDVLSGYAVGLAWSGFIYTSIEIICQKIRSRHVKKA